MQHFTSGVGYSDPTAAIAIGNVMREQRNSKTIRRGDIFFITDNGNTTGTEQHQQRPAVVVSNNEANKYSTTVEVVFLTKAYKTPLPTHTIVKAYRNSTALCEQIQSISVDRLEKYIRTCPAEEMRNIDKCLLISLGLDKRYGLK